MNLHQSRCFALLIAGLLGANLSFSQASAADTVAGEKPAVKKVDPLDEQLMKSLDNQLLDGLDDPSLRPAAKKAVAKPTDTGDKKPADSAGKPAQGGEPTVNPLSLPEEGEDLGEASERDPLRRIQRTMRAAGERLGKADADQPASKLQQQALTDLDELIRQLQNQQCNGQCNSPKKDGKPSSKPGSGKSGDPSKSQSPADQPAAESSDKLQKRQDAKVDLAELRSLTNDLWIRLPDKARQKINQLQGEEFLPKYQLLVEKYFRRLVEEDQDRP